jgi:hypothetical protein
MASANYMREVAEFFRTAKETNHPIEPSLRGWHADPTSERMPWRSRLDPKISVRETLCIAGRSLAHRKPDELPVCSPGPPQH